MPIFRRTVLAALMAVVTAGAGVAHAEVSIKPGLWEVRLTRQFLNGQDVTALLPFAAAGLQAWMVVLSPQQRAQLEAALGKDVAQGKTTQRLCVSPQMAAGDKPLLPPNAKCQPASFFRFEERVAFNFDCQDRGRHFVGKGESTLANEQVGTWIDTVVTDANGRYALRSESTAYYIGDDCGTLKPADQAVRDSNTAR